MRSKLTLLFLITTLLLSCTKKQNPLSKLINENVDLHSVASNLDYEVQVLYTQIDRDSLNKPHFTTYNYQLDDNQYFYPASTVKFPSVLIALEKLNQLGIPSSARMEIDSAYSGQSAVTTDSTSLNLEPSISQYAKKILLVSDNDAFNRLYEFIGQDNFNHILKEKGYTQSRINHRLSISLTNEENARTNPMRFYVDDEVIYKQDMQIGTGNYSASKNIKKGIGYISQGELVNGPFDFSSKNFFPLREQHEMMQALIFPESFPEKAFDLRSEDRELVLKYSSIAPKESKIEAYQDMVHYWDSFAKFLVHGSQPDSEIPENIQIFNKIGLAYGYTIDNAYIIDTLNNVEFFLTAVIHTNSNQIFNDNEYEYDEIALPFMAKLGQSIYNFELERPKKYTPNFENIFD
tara:strand:- start:37303 stop:38517 length:1215 start_codon:yes stop_codon:yes gene_type:complete